MGGPLSDAAVRDAAGGHDCPRKLRVQAALPVAGGRAVWLAGYCPRPRVHA